MFQIPPIFSTLEKTFKKLLDKILKILESMDWINSYAYMLQTATNHGINSYLQC